MPAQDIFQLLVKYNKKAIECVDPYNKDFHPDDILIYLDQISILKNVLILNKPLSELKATKEDLEMWLNRYVEGIRTVSKGTKKQMLDVLEHIKGELEEANKYLAEAISIRR